MGAVRIGVDTMDVNVISKYPKLPSNRYEAVFRTAQAGILILEYPSGKIIDTNDYFVNLTGYNCADILHKELWEFGFLGDRDKSIRAFKELLTKNYIRYDNISLRHITGRMVPVEFVGNIYAFDNTIQIQCNVRDISDRVLAQEGLLQAQLQLVEMLFGAITCIGQLVEARDTYTAGHQTRVAKLAVAIADHLKLSSDEIICLRVAALTHDLGKTMISSRLLNKRLPLSPSDWRKIKSHPRIGAALLKPLSGRFEISRVVGEHHEREDGSGYPCGLTAVSISLLSKILAVADVVDAMTNARPYRPAFGLEVALDEITKQAGILFSKDVVKVCTQILRNKNFTLQAGVNQ